MGPLGVDEQTETFVEGEAAEFRVLLLGPPGIGEAAHAHRDQVFVDWFIFISRCGAIAVP